jgi:hypothetical protein
MNRRGFLKSIAAAPLVAFVPGVLWIPDQKLAVPELKTALAPLAEAIGEEAGIYGFAVPAHWWAFERYRQQIWWDAHYHFPARKPVVIITGDAAGLKALPFRFAWHGAGLPRDGGQELPVVQTWANGEELEPQLWLA